MAKQSGQKFVARNRAPRVQIEYDVEVYGSEKKVQLPFVMGVLADLSGKPAEALPGLADRKFLEVDVDNFDNRLKSMKPRVAFNVPNTLTGEGNVSVDVTFESMDDFSPDAIAEKVEPLKKLLDVRNELSNLMTYMDGKSGAEELIAKLMQDPALLASMTAAPNASAAEPEAQAPTAEPESDSGDAPADDTESPSEGDDKSDGDGDGTDNVDDLLSDL
ncbi:type VI secretion system contractile sheath small subunit [Mariniblastus sp.]|nr:type VI secretion system contractile sheath small subunit [Mariniblastus sp.]